MDFEEFVNIQTFYTKFGVFKNFVAVSPPVGILYNWHLIFYITAYCMFYDLFVAFLFDLMGGEIFGEEQPSERLWLMEVAEGLTVQIDTWSG